MTVALSKYTRAYDVGPFVQDKRYMEQYAALPEQKRAWERWSNTQETSHAIPHLYMESEELTEFAQLRTQVTDYLSEMEQKMIIGTEPLENYDQMIDELHARGVDRLLEMYQSAYERFLNK